MAFRIGAEDGEYLEREYWPTFRASDLQSLSAYDIYVKLSIDGKTTDAFSAMTLPEPVLHESHRDAIIQLTRTATEGKSQLSNAKLTRGWLIQYVDC